MESKEEIRWVDIEGYEGRYRINIFGQVYSVIRDKIMVNSTSVYGYKIISLTKENHSKNKMVHRLVAQAFIPNPENKKEINHIDGNKQNNHVSNLEWVTRSENMKHAFNTGLCDKSKYSSNAKTRFRKRIELFSEDGKLLQSFKSVTEASEKTGLSKGAISRCINGLQPYCFSYVKYKFIKQK